MSRCHSLNLFFSSKAVLCIFETKAEKQIAENSPFGFSVETLQFLCTRKFLRDPFYSCRLPPLAVCSGC